MKNILIIMLSIFLLGSIPCSGGEGSSEKGTKEEPRPFGGGIRVWDDKVFDLEEPEPPEKKGDRYYDYSGPRYNVEQLRQADEVCDPQKKQDWEGYKQCRKRELKKSSRKVQEQRESVEKKRELPRRNVPPLLPEALKRDPTFEGLKEEEELER